MQYQLGFRPKRLNSQFRYGRLAAGLGVQIEPDEGQRRVGK